MRRREKKEVVRGRGGDEAEKAEPLVPHGKMFSWAHV